MSKLLIYIGENKKFDVANTIAAISSIEGISNAREGEFIGAVFECLYSANGKKTIVRIGEGAETVTVEGLGEDSLGFALELQKHLPIPLYAIDMDYSFNLALRDYKTIAEFKNAIKGGQFNR